MKNNASSKHLRKIFKIIFKQNRQSKNYPSDKEIANIEKRSEWLLKYLHLLRKNTLNSKIKAVRVDQYPWGRYEPPYPPSYGLNSTTTVLLGEWLWY